MLRKLLLINNLQKKNELKLTEVPSPTFNIVNEYQIGEIVVNHYDLFKIKDPKELYNIGIFENNSEIPSSWKNCGSLLGDHRTKNYVVYFHFFANEIN